MCEKTLKNSDVHIISEWLKELSESIETHVDRFSDDMPMLAFELGRLVSDIDQSIDVLEKRYGSRI